MHLFDEADEPNEVTTEVNESMDDTSMSLPAGCLVVWLHLSCLLAGATSPRWSIVDELSALSGSIRAKALLHLRAKLIVVTRPLIIKKVLTASVAFRIACKKRDEQDKLASGKRLSARGQRMIVVDESHHR